MVAALEATYTIYNALMLQYCTWPNKCTSSLICSKRQGILSLMSCTATSIYLSCSCNACGNISLNNFISYHQKLHSVTYRNMVQYFQVVQCVCTSMPHTPATPLNEMVLKSDEEIELLIIVVRIIFKNPANDSHSFT